MSSPTGNPAHRSITAAGIQPCCLRGFPWLGTPTGSEVTLPGTSNPAYVAYPPGHSGGAAPSRAAILLIHDLFGWTFPNVRLLADAYAREAGATVYAPDFFGGRVLPANLIRDERWDELDLPTFIAANGRDVREAEIVGYARAMRARGHERVAAAGFCYGGWAVFRLGAGEFFSVEEEEEEEEEDVEGGGGEKEGGTRASRKKKKKPLVDCIVAGHPTFLTKEDIDGVEVPVQVLAPEIDIPYTDELKLYTFTTLQKKGVPFDYQHFPKAVHACFVRGDERKQGERAAMERGKNAAVAWLRHWLHDWDGVVSWE